VRSATRRQYIALRTAVILGEPPFALDQPFTFEPAKRRKERAGVDREGAFADLGDADADGVGVDDAENDCANCFSSNSRGPAHLADYCNEYNVQLLTFSSDLVFDGKKKMPYYESDKINPLNMYGRSKAIAEQSVLYNYPLALVVRTSAFFGPWDQYNFVYNVIDSLKKSRELCTPVDVFISPTYVPDLCHRALDLFIDEEEGIWHLSNDGMTSWSSFAHMIAQRMGYKKNKLVAKPLVEMGWKASRPLYSVLQSEKGIKLPHFENALERYITQNIL